MAVLIAESHLTAEKSCGLRGRAPCNSWISTRRIIPAELKITKDRAYVFHDISFDSSTPHIRYRNFSAGWIMALMKVLSPV
jgi:hypothetical protein